MSAVKGISEPSLYVDDMRRSVAFYHRVFGFPVLTASDRLSALRVAPLQMLLIVRKGPHQTERSRRMTGAASYTSRSPCPRGS